MMESTTRPVGFIGLGAMGEPMALNLLNANVPLVVWNRTPAKCESLRQAGADIAESVSDVFARCDVVIVMLLNADVMDAVLTRGQPEFSACLKDRTLIHMGTTSPEYSHALEADVLAAGGSYVEAPVSGSRIQAETQQLITMLAGEPSAVAAVKPLVLNMCREASDCGTVPNGLKMKLAVNVYLVNTMASLAEAFHFAEGQELNLETFVNVINASPMASALTKIKTEKLLKQDFAKQAAVADAGAVSAEILKAADLKGITTPLTKTSASLYEKAKAMGLGESDMSAIVHAI